MPDSRPSMSAALDAFALDAVVTPPDGSAVETRAFWALGSTIEIPPGGDLRRAERRRVLVLPLDGLDGLTEVPRGTAITMADYEGGPQIDWRVDAFDSLSFDHLRVVVVPA